MPESGNATIIEKGLWQWAQVTSVVSPTQFIAARLLEFPDGYFNGWTIYVTKDGRSTESVIAAPQAERRSVTAFSGPAAAVTHLAFTTQLQVGDEIILIHPDLASSLKEQADVPVTINAIAAAETNILNLAAAGTRYSVRSLRLKCANPGANNVRVRLYELVNDVATVVQTFDITGVNWTTYFSLMDMFGLPELTGDQLRVTVQATGGGPYAITGQYSYATAT
ncbi:MAG: hypothetical protein WC359_12285 [Dehalococcoidia bacterium]|jgi:hypothetical protein